MEYEIRYMEDQSNLKIYNKNLLKKYIYILRFWCILMMTGSYLGCLDFIYHTFFLYIKYCYSNIIEQKRRDIYKKTVFSNINYLYIIPYVFLVYKILVL